MQASTGDRILVHSHHVGGTERTGTILEVHGPDGLPPYVVEWSDTGQTSLFFPSTDAEVQHVAETP